MQALAAVQDQLRCVVNDPGVRFLLDVDHFVGQFLAVDIDAHGVPPVVIPKPAL
ncbi:hypothetical protein D3C85_1910870 [compost metagenome]